MIYESKGDKNNQHDTSPLILKSLKSQESIRLKLLDYLTNELRFKNHKKLLILKQSFLT